MATEQHDRLSSSRLTALKNIIGLVPALVLIAAIINTSSCGSGGLLTPVGGGGGGGSSSSTKTGSASSTPTPTGALAFVTNFNDGNVSSFTRNTSTGALTLTGKMKAGKNGPRGVVAAPSGAFLYVANINDDNIYEFSVGSKGKLTSLTSVSPGNGTGPDELAITTSAVSGTLLLWVTNANKGTVAWYTVNASTGLINTASQGSIGGFNTPFGITLHPTLAVLYVSDTVTGLIQPMSYNTTTGALTKNFPAVSSSDPLAVKPAAIAVDSAGAALFIADQGNGEASSFSIDGTGKLTPVFAVANVSTSAVPVGVGIGVNAGAEFLFTANQGANSVSSFLVTSVTTVHTPPTTTTSPYLKPTGLVVDPQNMFVYTANFGDGTVGQSTIKGACGFNICVGPTVSTGGSGPFGITLAQ
jgi:6-phosphogluconolactonase